MPRHINTELIFCLLTSLFLSVSSLAIAESNTHKIALPAEGNASVKDLRAAYERLSESEFPLSDIQEKLGDLKITGIFMNREKKDMGSKSWDHTEGGLTKSAGSTRLAVVFELSNGSKVEAEVGSDLDPNAIDRLFKNAEMKARKVVPVTMNPVKVNDNLKHTEHFAYLTKPELFFESFGKLKAKATFSEVNAGQERVLLYVNKNP